jgi:hypothetical protein
MWPLRRKPTPSLERTNERELIGLAHGGSGGQLAKSCAATTGACFARRAPSLGVIGKPKRSCRIPVRAFRALANFRGEGGVRQAAVREIRLLLEGAIDALPAPFREVFILRGV